MRKKTGKRLLSIVLSTMLLIGCLPLSASAADITTGKMIVSLTAATELGEIDGFEDDGYGTLTATGSKEKLTLETIGKYAQATEVDGIYEDVKGASYATALKANVAKANGLFTGSSTISAAPGATIWLGVKFDGSQLQDALTYGGGLFFEYDESVFDTSVLTKSNMVLNNIDAGTIKMTEAIAKNVNMNKVDAAAADQTGLHFNKFTPEGAVDCSADVTDASLSGRHFFNITLSDTSTKWPIPSGSTWDLVFPLKIKSSAASSSTGYKISLMKDAIGTNKTSTGAYTDVANKLGNCTQVSKIDNSILECADLTVKVTGPEIALGEGTKVKNTTNQSITVVASNVTPDANNWKIVNSNDNSDTGITVTAAVTGQNVTLSFDGSTLDASKTYKVEWTTGGNKLYTAEFSITKSMAGTASITGTAKLGETLTASLGGAGAPSTGLHYEWKIGGTKVGTDASTLSIPVDKAHVGKTVTVTITADSYEGSVTSDATSAIAKKDGATATGTISDAKEYGADITNDVLAAVKTALSNNSLTVDDLTFTQVSSSILTVSGKKVTVGKGAISGSNNTVTVKTAEGDTQGASTVTVSLTTKNKKPLTLGTVGTATSGGEYTLPVLTGMVAGDTAPAISWTVKSTGSKIDGTPTIANGKTTITLTDATATTDNTVVFTAAAITHDDYSYAGEDVTVTVQGIKGTTVDLDATSKTAGFSIDKNFVEENTSKTISITVPAGYKLDKITGTGVSDANTTAKTFKFTAGAGNTTATVTLTYHQVITAYLIVADKDYDGTKTATVTANTASDGTGTNVPITYTKAEFAKAEADTGIAVTVTGLVADDKTNEYDFTNAASLIGTINAVDLSTGGATGEAKAEANVSAQAPTTTDVEDAVKGATITFTVNGKTFTRKVSDLLSSSADIAGAIAAAINGKEEFAGTPAPTAGKYDATQSAQSVNANPGATITTSAVTAGAVYSVDPAVTGFTVNADGSIAVASDVAANTYTLNVKDDQGNTCALTVTVAAPVTTYAVENLAEGATGTITLSDISTLLDATKDDSITAFPSPIELEFTVTKSAGGGPGGPGILGWTVTYDAGGHGSLGSADTELVSNGAKPVAVPEVKANKGYTFLGWTIDGTTIVNPADTVISDNTTFTALYKKGYMDGYEDGKIYPKREVKRSEFTKMLVVATGLYDPTKTYTATKFSDDKGRWYTNYIACAVEAGIVDGYEDNTFRPERTIKREEAAAMIYRALGNVTPVDTTTKVTDFNTVSSWAKTYVASLVEAGIIAGYEDGSFQPKALISRAETATMINRMVGFDPTEEQVEEIKGSVKSPYSDVTTSNWAFAHLMYACGLLDDAYYAE